MTLELILYLIACLVLAAASCYMIFARCYPDGLIGKISLGAMAFGTGIPVAQWLTDAVVPVSRTTLVLVLGVAVFVIRHLHRFWRHRRAYSRRPV